MKGAIGSFYFDYYNLSMLTRKLGISVESIVYEAMKGEITLYCVNQSTKVLQYYPLEYNRGRFWIWNTLKVLFARKEIIDFLLGEMIPIKSHRFFDLLLKGLLTERQFLQVRPDDQLVLSNSLNPLFRYIGWNYIFNTFHPIGFKHIYLHADELETLRQLFRGDDNEKTAEETERVTKQDQRVRIFLSWLQNKDENVVRHMKKEDVLEALREIDPHLFMGDQKHFFRMQKIITFKSGRKAQRED